MSKRSNIKFQAGRQPAELFKQTFSKFGFSQFTSNGSTPADVFFAGNTRPAEIGFIPFSTKSFVNFFDILKTLAEQFDTPGRLTVVSYFWSDLDGPFDFDNFANNRNFGERIGLFNEFVNSFRKWARENISAVEIRFVAVPVFQDKAPDASSFGRLLDFVGARQQADGTGEIELRRNPTTSSFSFNITPQEFFYEADSFRKFSFSNSATAEDISIVTINSETFSFAKFPEFRFTTSGSFLFCQTIPSNGESNFTDAITDENEADFAFGFDTDFFFAIRRTFDNR